MKVFALVWVIGSAAYAGSATVMYWEPATTFIEISSSRDGSFYFIIPFALTWIIALIPLFFVMLLNNFIQNKKNTFPADFNGKTGIVIQREKEFQNAALQYSILINGAVKKKVGMGKKFLLNWPREIIPYKPKWGSGKVLL